MSQVTLEDGTRIAEGPSQLMGTRTRIWFLWRAYPELRRDKEKLAVAYRETFDPEAKVWTVIRAAFRIEQDLRELGTSVKFEPSNKLEAQA